MHCTLTISGGRGPREKESGRKRMREGTWDGGEGIEREKEGGGGKDRGREGVCRAVSESLTAFFSEIDIHGSLTNSNHIDSRY